MFQCMVSVWLLWKMLGLGAGGGVVLRGWLGILCGCGFECWMGVLCSYGFEDWVGVLCGRPF